jgi:hypothetical protein
MTGETNQAGAPGTGETQGQKPGTEKVRQEEIFITGDALVAKIKELVHEGNVRRITIKNEDGKPLIEIPLTIGVVGALLLPVWAAVGAIAALAAKLTIVVEKIEPAPKSEPAAPAAGNTTKTDVM